MRGAVAIIAAWLIPASIVSAQVAGNSPGIAGGGEPIGTEVIQRPAGFTMPLPFSVVRRPDNSYRHMFDADSRKPTPSVSIYVGTGGNNANDCLTWATRCRSLKQGIVRANSKSLGTVVRLLAQTGVYKLSSVDGSGIQDSFAGQAVLRDLVIEPCDANGNPVASGQIVSLHDQPITSANWVSEGGSVYSIMYNGSTELPNDSAWDAAFNDNFGRPRPLMSIHSSLVMTGGPYAGNPVAAVNHVAGRFGRGAMYRDTAAKKIYVRLSDDRAPDANLVLSRGSDGSTNSRNLYIAGNVSDRTLRVWARNLDLWGGYPVRVDGNEATNKKHEVTLVDFFVGYGRASGVVMTSSGSIALLRGRANSPAGDAYTYTLAADLVVGTTTNVLDVYEIDCKADWVGQIATSDRSTNGSSFHYNVRGMRVNGSYAHVTDRVVHDIQNAQSLNLGLTVGPHANYDDQTSIGFTSGYALAGTGPQSSQMWIDGARFAGPLSYGLETANNGENGPGGGIYLRNTGLGALPRSVDNAAVAKY